MQQNDKKVSICRFPILTLTYLFSLHSVCVSVVCTCLRVSSGRLADVNRLFTTLFAFCAVVLWYAHVENDLCSWRSETQQKSTRHQTVR